MDPETGAGGYLIGGGMSGGYFVVFDGENHQVGFFRFVPIQTGNKLGFEAAVMYGELFFGEGSGMLGLYHWNAEVIGGVDSIFRTGIEASAKVVYVAIQERCGKGRHCSWASLDTIAEDAGTSVSTVRRAIIQLTEAGYLIEKKGAANKRYRYPLVRVPKE